MVDIEIPVPVGLTFPEAIAGGIEETPYQGDGPSEVNPSLSHHFEFAGEADREDKLDDDSPEMHFRREMRQDMMTLGNGAEFRSKLTEMS